MDSPPDLNNTAVIYDFASYRLKSQSRRRWRSGERRQFLWSWPATGQVLAVDFPFSPAKPIPSLASRAR